MNEALPQFPPKSEFRKWLRSLPPDEVVAESWNCCSCPLAVWLARTGIAESPYISPGSDGGRWAPKALQRAECLTIMPDWANNFGSSIDMLGGYYRPVTAADCLRVLARTPRA